MSLIRTMLALSVALLAPLSAAAQKPFAYPYAPYNEGKMDPQRTGWPLTDAERAYVLKPEFARRPGSEAGKHDPALWPVTPAAGYWGGTNWLDTHAKLVEHVRANRGPVDVLLVGDSITQQWGSPLDTGKLNAAWQSRFPRLKAVNIGIGGDKAQNVLWRLDHGGVEGLAPRIVVLMIGNNNMFFTPETGTEAAARGVAVCAANLLARFPKASLVVAKILPAHAPGVRFHEDMKKTNAALDQLKLDRDPRVRIIDLWADFTRPDGTLKPELFAPDGIHLSPAGYELYAQRLQPLLAPSGRK
ncbi:MAG: GDSL-type esterase/lipase family protein [Armatimonadetes bacterium]|nr:GDSL-type esterase/lipase family protein [Armatimonadota bacterium]